MNLILVSYLVSTPPSEGLFVRYLTMKSKEDLDFCNVIESPKSNWDDIYKSLNEKKLWDYFYDFVEPDWRVEWVRLDTQLNYPMTVKADYIRCENTLSLIGQLKAIRQL